MSEYEKYKSVLVHKFQHIYYKAQTNIITHTHIESDIDKRTARNYGFLSKNVCFAFVCFFEKDIDFLNIKPGYLMYYVTPCIIIMISHPFHAVRPIVPKRRNNLKPSFNTCRISIEPLIFLKNSWISNPFSLNYSDKTNCTITW